MKKLKILFIVLTSILTFFIIINIIPPRKVIQDNPFIVKDGIPLLTAHRGGSITSPENTLKAFKEAVETYNADILESDLWLTKDKKLVFNHDSSIDRTSDAKELEPEKEKHLISDYTLEELNNFNFGYSFKDTKENYPYQNIVTKEQENRKQVLKENDISILEFDEMLKYFYTNHKQLRFIFEIKNSGEDGKYAADLLIKTIGKYEQYTNRYIIGTFHDEVVTHLKEKHPTVFRGAAKKGVTSFVITEMFKVNLFDKNDCVAIQMPIVYTKYKLRFDKKYLIRRAHRRNMAIQYWTVNEREDMEKLIRYGCDAIMTDNPKLLREVIEEYKQKNG